MTVPPETDELHVPELDEVEGSVLGMLVDRYPALVAIEDELVRDLNHPSRQNPVPAQIVREAVESLARGGLAYVVDERFALLTRAAFRANALKD
jgi:hypothetical protein